MSTLFEINHAGPVFGPAGIALVVFGTPAPQGSTKAFIPKGWQRPVITADNRKTKPWKQQIAGAAAALNQHPFAKDVPLAITLDFYLAKPASVTKRRTHPIVKPDLDKLVRAVFDALTGIMFADDAQVIALHTRKHYGQPERVEIQIQEVLCSLAKSSEVICNT